MTLKDCKYLIDLGFSPQHKGFFYLAAAIAAARRIGCSKPITGNDLYNLVYAEYGATRERAERCMRYAITYAWENSCAEARALFGCVSAPPRITELVRRIAILLSDDTE